MHVNRKIDNRLLIQRYMDRSKGVWPIGNRLFRLTRVIRRVQCVRLNAINILSGNSVVTKKCHKRTFLIC